MNYSEEKIDNIKMSVSLFLENDIYINEVAQIIGVSRSSVQRYLNDPLVEIIYGKKIVNKIKEKLKNNYNKGKQKGGINYSKNNQYVKRRDGKFNGSIKKH